LKLYFLENKKYIYKAKQKAKRKMTTECIPPTPTKCKDCGKVEGDDEGECGGDCYFCKECRVWISFHDEVQYCENRRWLCCFCANKPKYFPIYGRCDCYNCQCACGCFPEEEEEEEAEEESEEDESEEEEEEEEEEYEAVVQEEWVPYYNPPRNIPSDIVIAILEDFDNIIVKMTKVRENRADLLTHKMGKVFGISDEELTKTIELTEFKIKLMRLAKTIISTLGKIGFNPDIVRMFYTRYTETLVDYDDWMSKNLPEGEYLTKITIENKLRNHLEKNCVDSGVLPVPKPDYL
jgi:hypothetical protein